MTEAKEIEKLIDVGDDLWSIEIKQGTRLLGSYSLDKYRNKNVKVTIKIEEISINWIDLERDNNV